MKKFFLLIYLSLLISSPALAADPYRQIAKDLTVGISKLKSPRVAVLALPYHNGIENTGSAMVAERIITQLAQKKGLRLVERNLLRTLLEENKLSETGVIDAATAKAAGKVLGVDIVVSGTLIDLGQGQTEVNARAMEIETGKILAASQVVVNKTWPDSSSPKRRPEPMPYQSEERPIDDSAIEIGYPVGRPGFGPSKGR